MEKAKNPRQIRGDRKKEEKEGERQIHGEEMPLTHDTIRRFRLLRWILKDRPEIITFSLFFPFYSSIIISEERRMAMASIYHVSTCAQILLRKSCART